MLTIAFIIGFAAGWYVNEKVENLGEKLNQRHLKIKKKNFNNLHQKFLMIANTYLAIFQM